ncbi:MAG: crossover junction endodeoxyribonuclease RuvC [Parcubacteria group bacterium]|nr:crossover junction endodeoxyribonuclease RuvC [Parcubacteria group bacterium]
MSLVLGIDPGIARCGYGLVRRDGSAFVCVDYGCLETPAGMETAARLELLFGLIKGILKGQNIDRVGVEKLFFSKNTKTAFQVGQARGVIMLALAAANAKIMEFTPNEVKQSVCGYGQADKKQMQKMVQLTLKIKDIPQPDDAADALAVAITAATWHELS